jgi:hypothetical protein
VVEFSGFIEYTAGLTPVSDTEAIEEIKRQINRFRYFGYTDIGYALRTGVEILLADDYNSPMIILFTDGITEIGPRQAQLGRTVGKSHSDVLWALNELDGRIPVHTIGLNSEGSVDVALLNMIAEYSTATATFTTRAGDIPQIFTELYQNHVQAVRQAAQEAPAQPPADEATVTQNEATPDDTPADEAPMDESLIGEAPSDEALSDEAPFDEALSDETPADTAPRSLSPFLLWGILLAVIAVVFVNVRWVLGILNRRKAANIDGYLDIVVITGSGNMLPATQIDLDFAHGRIGFAELGVDLEGLYLAATANGLTLINTGDCEVTDPNNVIQARRKIVWHKDVKLTFTEADAQDLRQIEIIYRANGDPII